MNISMTRLTARCAVPLFAIAALFAAGEPLPEQAAPVSVEQLVEDSLSVALEHEAEALRLQAEATRQHAQAAAIRIRWSLTLPALHGKRCAAPSCAS